MNGYVIVRQVVPAASIERLAELLWAFDEKDPLIRGITPGRPAGLSACFRVLRLNLHCYTCGMSSKLSSGNPYMRDPVLRQQSVLTSVAGSSAIEGIHAPFKQGAVTSPSSTPASTAPQSPVTRRKP